MMGSGNIIKRKRVALMKLKVLPETHAEEIDLKQVIIDKQLLVVRRVKEQIHKSFKINATDNSLIRFEFFSAYIWQLVDNETKKDDLNRYLDFNAKAGAFQNVIQLCFGYGILDSLLNDAEITEITVDGMDGIYYEKNGIVVRAVRQDGSPLKFDSVEDIYFIIAKIISPAGVKLNTDAQEINVRLPNGFRVNAVLQSGQNEGNHLTIKKSPDRHYSMGQFVQSGMISSRAADFLHMVVDAECNVIICGKAGSGRTTFLDAMSCLISGDLNILTMEKVEETSSISMENLARTTALRCKSRILIDGIPNEELYALIHMMSIGQKGVIFTGEASSSREMIEKLEAIAVITNEKLPRLLVRRKISSAIQFVIHIGKLRNGARKVFQITEVLGAVGDGYVMQDIFKYIEKPGYEAAEGELTYMGVLVKRMGQFIIAGINPSKIINQQNHS